MKMTVRVLAALFVLAGTALTLAMPAPLLPIVAVALPGAARQQQPAEVQITVSNAGTHPKLGLPDFNVTAGDPELAAAAKTIADVLWADLNYEREYYMIPRQTSASIPVTGPESLPFQAWTEIGAEQVLVAVASRNGDAITIDMRAIGVKGQDQGRQMFGARYQNCRMQNPRLCAHSIADDFHKVTRALDGVARTKIAFASDRAGTRAGRPGQSPAAGKEIYICDYDGANPMRVTVNGSINGFPSWSPNGALLSFVSWMSGYPDIYVANIAEPGRPLARPFAGRANVENWTPAWSPDGSKVAFASTRGGNGTDIFVANPDGTGLQNLTNSPGVDEGTPAWSPSGAQIAYTSNRAGVNQLLVMNASGTGSQLLVSRKVDRPTWSNKNFIAFTVETTAGHDIGIYDFATPGVKILTDGKGSNESPSVAPNGRHVVFFTTRWGRAELATMDRTGENIRRLTEVGNNVYPSWQGIAGGPAQ